MEVAKCPCGKWQVEISAGIGMFTARSKVTLFIICFTNVCFMLELTGWKLEGALEREDLSNYPKSDRHVSSFFGPYHVAVTAFFSRHGVAIRNG